MLLGAEIFCGDYMQKRSRSGSLKSVSLNRLLLRSLEHVGLEAWRPFITSVMNPPKRDHAQLDTTALFEGQVLDPGLPATIEPKNAETLVKLYVRYESTCGHRMRKYLQDLERVQGQRKGEKVAAPRTIDAAVEVIPLCAETPTGTGPCSPDTPKLPRTFAAAWTRGYQKLGRSVRGSRASPRNHST